MGRSGAGVAAGIARALGVDATWVRIAFVAATFFGGLGVAVYLAAWLMLPVEGSPEAGRALVRRDLGGGRLVGVIALLLVVFAVVADGPGHAGFGFWFPPLFVLLGVGLYLWRTDELNRAGAAPWPPQDQPPTTPAQPTSTQSTSTQPTSALGPVHGPAVPPPPASPLGPVVIALSLITLAAAAALDRLDWVDVSLAGALGSALAVTAAGLVVSAFVGRGRALIGWGVALALALGVVSVADAADLPFGAGAGERRYQPATRAELESSYELGAGQLIVDLGDVDFRGSSSTVEIDLGVGEVRVLVPDDVTVEVEGHAGLGAVELFGRDYDGVDPDGRVVRQGVEGGGRLLLDVEVGFGQVIVTEAA